MDYTLGLWGALTFLAILGALRVEEIVSEAHKRGMERVRRAR